MSGSKNTKSATPTPDPPLREEEGQPVEASSINATPATPPSAEGYSMRSALTSAGGAGQGTSPAVGQTVVHEAKIPHQWHFISTFNADTLEKLQQNVQMAINRQVSPAEILKQRIANIHSDLHEAIELRLSTSNVPNWQQWKTWDHTTFFTNIKNAFKFGSGKNHTTDPVVTFQAGTATLTLDFDPTEPNSWVMDYGLVILKLLKDIGTDQPFSESQLEGLIKELVENLRHSKPTSPYANTVGVIRDTLKLELTKFTDIKIFLTELSILCEKNSIANTEKDKYMLPDRITTKKDKTPTKDTSSDVVVPTNKQQRSYKRQPEEEPKPASGPVANKKQKASYVHEGNPSDKCNGCGRFHVTQKTCPFIHHPDHNKSSRSWETSSQGRALKEAGKDYLSGMRSILNPEWKPPSKSRGEESDLFCSLCDELNLISQKSGDPTVPITLLTPNFVPLTARALIDTGALHAN